MARPKRNSGGFAPANPPTASLAGPPQAPLRSADSLAAARSSGARDGRSKTGEGLERPHDVPDAPQDRSQPTTDTLPKRRYGGQELPDDVQDRPEQNAGYDEAVEGGSASGQTQPAGMVDVENSRDRGMRVREIPDELPPEERPPESPDDRAERDVVAEIRRRERRR